VVSGVGVVIRVRNAVPYVTEAVASVLDQTLPPAEVIIVDGDSTDGSIESLAPYASRIRVIPQRRQGLGGAAQDGIDALGSPIIAFQDADDIWPGERLQAMVQALDSHAEWGGVMGRVEHFISPEIPAEQAASFTIPAGPQPGVGLPSLVLRRAALDRAGGFREGLWAGEYMEWQDRATRAGVPIGHVDTLCLRRRVHLSNFTRSETSRRGYLQALQCVVARRRGDQPAS
jgi:glycosyltransferase involved in cell wall biosynthesis